MAGTQTATRTKKSSSSSVSTPERKSASARKAAPGKSGKVEKKGGPPKLSLPDSGEIVRAFRVAVNMSLAALKKWLTSEESRKVGIKAGAGSRESVGHGSGRHIMALLTKKRAEYTEQDFAHMRKVAAYVKRHLAQRPQGDTSETRWAYSLKNWGHDPQRSEDEKPAKATKAPKGMKTPEVTKPAKAVKKADAVKSPKAEKNKEAVTATKGRARLAERASGRGKPVKSKTPRPKIGGGASRASGKRSVRKTRRRALH